MRKLLLFVMIAVIFTACKKDDENINDVAKSEVVFAINENGDFKSVTPGNCPEDADGNVIEPAYAVVEINGVTYTPTLARVDGKLYTHSLKLDAPETGTQTYTVSKFLLYSSDDELIRATPESGSDYSEYVVKPVDFTFEVTAFNKAEVGVEVICFQPEEYSYFGFTWFGITEIELREVCFFGDICLNGDPFTPADFDGSLYGTELGVDVPAIMKIIVKKGEDQVPNSPFTNEGNLNAPLCVQYPDNLNIVGEEFTFELQLLLPDANGDFSYQTYYTYTATDEGELDIDNGDDEILDFVVGSCGYSGMADQTFDFEYRPVIVTPGETVLNGAAVRYRGNSSGNEIYLGVPNIATGSNRVEASYPNVYANWQDGTYDLTLSFNASENKMVTTIDDNNGDSKSLEYDFDDLLDPGCPTADWNAMNIALVDRLTTGEISFMNVTLNGAPVGSFDDEGWKHWTVTGFDFSQDWTLSGELVVQGWTGSETNKLEISVGCN